MIVSWTSSKEIVARVLRNTSIQDPNLIDNIREWIFEAVGLLETHYQLELKCEKVNIHMGKGKLPCSIRMLASVIYGKHRILPSPSDGPLLTPASTDHIPKNYTTRGTCLDIPEGINHLEETDVNNWPIYIKALDTLSTYTPSATIRYRVNFDRLEVGIQNGTVLVWFWSFPKGEDGFPAIPDNENYKSALYWYVRSMLIGSGYPDTVFNFDYAYNMWENFQARAMNQISTPSIDEARESLINRNRLMQLEHEWETFHTGEEEGPIYL